MAIRVKFCLSSDYLIKFYHLKSLKIISTENIVLDSINMLHAINMLLNHTKLWHILSTANL